MSWGEPGDTITHKTTGVKYRLFRKDVDGWIVQGSQSGYYKFTFEELGSDFTDPDKKRIKMTKEKARKLRNPKPPKERKINPMLDLF